MSVKRVLAAMAMLAAALPATAAITIDFEGLADGAPVGTNSLAAVAKYAGGQGNFINESSPNTAMFFLTGSALANVPAGFTGALSFYYSSEKSAVVNIYDGLNRTGNVIGSIALNAQSQQNNCDTPSPMTTSATGRSLVWRSRG